MYKSKIAFVLGWEGVIGGGGFSKWPLLRGGVMKGLWCAPIAFHHHRMKFYTFIVYSCHRIQFQCNSCHRIQFRCNYTITEHDSWQVRLGLKDALLFFQFVLRAHSEQQAIVLAHYSWFCVHVAAKLVVRPLTWYCLVVNHKTIYSTIIYKTLYTRYIIECSITICCENWDEYM